MNRKQSQADSVQLFCDEKDNKIKTLEDSVLKIVKEKAEMSKIVNETRKELAATKQLVTSYQGKLKKLSDTKAIEVITVFLKLGEITILDVLCIILYLYTFLCYTSKK